MGEGVSTCYVYINLTNRVPLNLPSAVLLATRFLVFFQVMKNSYCTNANSNFENISVKPAKQRYVEIQLTEN